jgi:hypothetical protein
MHKPPTPSAPESGPTNQRAVSRENAQTRARAIASRAGREPADVSQSDYEQAKRELTGTSDPAQQEELLTPPAPVRRPGRAQRP